MTQNTIQSRVTSKTIILATESRTGSNYLCNLMTTTGILGIPREYFSPYVSFDGVSEYSDRCRIAHNQGTSSNGVTAMKVFPEHWDLISKNFSISDHFPNRYWLWLRREDLLAQAISRVIALQTKAWVIENPRQASPVYSANEISRALNFIVTSESRWRLFFARNGITPLILWYEDLISSPIECVLQIGAFAGIDISPFEIQADVHIKIQRTDLNREWRDRFLSEMANIDYMDKLKRPAKKSIKNKFKYLWQSINE